jgi:polysaccharide biosynthesis protein PslF
VRVGSTPVPSEEGAFGRALRIGILSTYVPTACGLATFTAALARGLTAGGARVDVVRVADPASPSDGWLGSRSDRPVVGELVNGSPSSVRAAAELLNRCDAVVVQHEYGLYGGTDGDEVLDVLADVTVPSIVVAHTVLSAPTTHQHEVLVAIALRASCMVVMSEAARDRLISVFQVDPRRVVTIPHGATLPEPGAAATTHDRRLVLTSGLIGPGKGIERVVDAMRGLMDLDVRPRYLVAGQTHPKVLAASGEQYRHARIEQAWRNGVAASVSFDANYRDVASLTALLRSAAVVVLPYDSTDQATSGVLVDAVAAGRPVIATAFPHAVELLASGAGIVVAHDDADGLVRALRRVLTEPGVADRMAAEAARLAPELSWPGVAGRYQALAGRLLDERAVLV